MSITGIEVYYGRGLHGIKDYRFLPAPLMSISREQYKANDGTVLGGGYRINLEGSLLPGSHGTGVEGHHHRAGSYNALASFSEKDALLNYLNDSVSVSAPYKLSGTLMGSADCSGTPFCANITDISSVEFSSTDQWVNKVDYTIEMFAANTMSTGVSGLCAAGTDNIPGNLVSQDIEFTVEQEAKSTDLGGTKTPAWFKVTRSVSQQTIQGGTAQTFQPTLAESTFNAALESYGVNGGSGMYDNKIETSKNVGISFLGGSTNITTEFLTYASSGDASATEGFVSSGVPTGYNNGIGLYIIESYEVNVDSSLEQAIVNVSIDGTVRGVQPWMSGGVGIVNASYYMDQILNQATGSPAGDMPIKETGNPPLYARANAIYTQVPTTSSLKLPLIREPISKSIGYNINEGIITYTITYNNRPENCYSGALSESINVTRTNATPVIANLSILGRANGPIIQDIGTKSASETSVTIEALVVPEAGTGVCSGQVFNGQPAFYDELVNAVELELSGEFTTYFRTSDSKTFDPKQGRFTRNCSWIHTDC